MHINNCYKPVFAISLFSLAVWKFPKISGRPQYRWHTLQCPAGVWPANVCAKTEDAEDRSPYVRPSSPALWHASSLWRPLSSGILCSLSARQPRGKTSSCFLSRPFIVVSSCQDIDMNVTRRLGQRPVRGTGTKLYPRSPPLIH